MEVAEKVSTCNSDDDNEVKSSSGNIIDVGSKVKK